MELFGVKGAVALFVVGGQVVRGGEELEAEDAAEDFSVFQGRRRGLDELFVGFNGVLFGAKLVF